MNHSLYIRRRGKVVPPVPQGTETLPLEAATTLSINLDGLGYALSPSLLDACRGLSLAELGRFQRELVAALSRMVGPRRQFEPMYRNFPQQLMEASDAELYFNAILHYWSAGQLFPAQRKKLRLHLKEPPRLKYLDLGTVEEFEGLFGQIASANLSLSEQDKLDLSWFVEEYKDCVLQLMPESVPQKENAAYLSVLLLKAGVGEDFLRTSLKTATDVLRLSVALSGGDVSLASPTKFGKIGRSQRRFLLGVLEERPNVLEDMLRWKNRWKRLGERLHPREMASRYPKTAMAFAVLRNDLPASTFNGRVETALARPDVAAALEELVRRPGDFARRLDQLLRLDELRQEETLSAFRGVASKVSTPVLLQARDHFSTRGEPHKIRTFFPKGNVGKAYVRPYRLAPLSQAVADEAASALEEALLERFHALPSLGRTYVDPALRNFPVPFATRSASKALRTLPRGSRLPLPDSDTLRMFLWWTNGDWRTDIDLSAELMGEGFVHLDTLAYYNLRGYGCAHSGDIVDAPYGASEFIDLSLSKLKDVDVRYVAMVLTSFTEQPYVELPECFAGWMTRKAPESGEVYEPRTVMDRMDLTADTKAAIPLVFDLQEGVAIWCDLALRNHPYFVNAVGANLKGVALMVRAIVELKKATLYDLLSLHARARGELVEGPEGADTVFSVEAGTPFELERIGSEFMT
jgi:hypothetical protein